MNISLDDYVASAINYVCYNNISRHAKKIISFSWQQNGFAYLFFKTRQTMFPKLEILTGLQIF